MEVNEKADCAALPQPQRRGRPRFAVEGDCTLLLVRQGSSLACNIVDLSLGGCRIRTRERLPVDAGVRVEIGFKVNGVAFRFSGVTRWSDGRHLVGVQFEDMSARRQEELVEVVGEVEAAAAIKARKAAAEQQAMKIAASAAAVHPAPHPPLREHVGQPQESRPSRTVTPWSVAEPRPEPLRPRLSLIPQSSSRQQSNAPAKAPAAPVAGLSPAANPLAEQPLTAPPPASAPQSGPPPVKQERRSQVRRRVDTSATIFLVRSGAKLTGRILDLSLSGCRIRTDERFPLGIYTRVETEFRLEGLPFRLGGVIQAIHGPFAVGVRFLDMSQRKQEQVADLMEEIEETHAPGAVAGAITDKEGGQSRAVKPQM